jgi:hypothetical protein
MQALVQGVFFVEERLVQGFPVAVAQVEVADVTACAEAALASAAQDHGMDVRVHGPGIQVAAQGADHVQGKRIQAGRAVEGQMANVVADFAEHVVVELQGRTLGRGKNLSCHR